jgi:putative cardiolipin synthase
VRLFNPFCCGRDSLLNKYASSLADFGRLQSPDAQQAVHRRRRDGGGGRPHIADEYFMRSMSENFVDMIAFIVGAVAALLEAIFDGYWNSPYVWPVEALVGTDLDRTQLRASFNRLVDEGEQMMSLKLPPSDILGYGPISEDLDAGRVGLIWGKATAFADPPAKVTATSDDMARSMSVSMNVMDLVMASTSEVVISSPYFIPGTRGVAAFGDLGKKSQGHDSHNSLAANDEPLVHTGYSRYRVDLLKTGVDLAG